MINREVKHEFFLKLKNLFEQNPGEQKIQLVIGEKVIPVSLKVKYNPELTTQIDELIKENS